MQALAVNCSTYSAANAGGQTILQVSEQCAYITANSGGNTLLGLLHLSVGHAYGPLDSL
jgi:hypothetical protein